MSERPRASLCPRSPSSASSSRSSTTPCSTRRPERRWPSTAAVEGGAAAIRVADHGSGIHGIAPEAVFERFARSTRERTPTKLRARAVPRAGCRVPCRRQRRGREHLGCRDDVPPEAAGRGLNSEERGADRGGFVGDDVDRGPVEPAGDAAVVGDHDAGAGTAIARPRSGRRSPRRPRRSPRGRRERGCRPPRMRSTHPASGLTGARVDDVVAALGRPRRRDRAVVHLECRNDLPGAAGVGDADVPAPVRARER